MAAMPAAAAAAPPADHDYALFDAIVAMEPLAAIRSIVEERPLSVQARPPPPRGREPRWRQGTWALHLAVECGLPDDALRFIYRCHPQALRERDADGSLPLHHLGRTGRRHRRNEVPPETIRFFVGEHPESLHQRNGAGELVLHAAAGNEFLSVDVVPFLVEQYPPAVQVRDGRGRTPLLVALDCCDSSFDWVRYLVQQGPLALQERDNDGRLPIHAAAAKKRLLMEHIRCLVEPWPDSVRERDGQRRLPLHLVAGRSGLFNHEHSLPIVRYLLDAYPEAISERGGEDDSLAGHEASRAGAPTDLMRLLVQLYPQGLEAWTAQGSLALHLAVRYMAARPDFQAVKTLEFLVEQSPQAVREVVRDGSGCIGLHLMAAGGLYHYSTAVLRLLLQDWPESALVRNLAGRTALHEVADHDYISENSHVFAANPHGFAAMRLLVEVGPGALRLRDNHGGLPLHYLLARQNPDLPVVRFLVESWPRSLLVPDAEGMYPLFVAAATGAASLDVLYYLVKRWPGHYFLRQR